MQGAVELRSVAVRYGHTTAVHDVSLTVPPGSVLALLGDNGAGKTSLLQVCEGFRRPDGGAASVLGLDPVADHDALMPRIGIMLQTGGVYPWATVGEILSLFASFAAHPLDTGMLLDRLGLRKVLKTRWRRLGAVGHGGHHTDRQGREARRHVSWRSGICDPAGQVTEVCRSGCDGLG